MIQNPTDINPNNILARINMYQNLNVDENTSLKASAMIYENQLLHDSSLNLSKFAANELPALPTIEITPGMLSGKVFYSVYNDYEFGNINYGKIIFNADNTIAYHEVALNSNGALVNDSEFSETMGYGLSNGQITIMTTGDGDDKVFTLNSTTTSAWKLTDEKAEPNTWYLTKPTGCPDNL